jgi:hypothetical protein
MHYSFYTIHYFPFISSRALHAALTIDDGTPNLLLKMRFHDSIGALKGFILGEMKAAFYRRKKASNSHTSTNNTPEPTMYTFELRTNFPARVYATDTQTLHQAGLAPNANLFVRTLK